MKTSKNASLTLKLSALAGAAGIAPAHAAIIPSATLPLTPPSTQDNIFWDIDGSGHGFSLANGIISSQAVAQLNAISANIVGSKLYGLPLIANMSLHAVVGPTLANGNQFFFPSVGTHTITSNGNNNQHFFTKGTPGYFGFKFTGSNNITDYGWGTLLITGTPAGQGFTIQNAYYDNTGASIKVGQTTAVPEPSSIALLALGATGLAAWRLRKKTAEKAA